MIYALCQFFNKNQRVRDPIDVINSIKKVIFFLKKKFNYFRDPRFNENIPNDASSLLRLVINEVIEEDYGNEREGKKVVTTDLEKQICFYTATYHHCLEEENTSHKFEKWIFNYTFELILEFPESNIFFLINVTSLEFR